jgi:glycosyltransferase involved in cell wall biosynthesis
LTVGADEAEVAACVVRLLTDAAAAQADGAAARARVLSEFSWERSADLMEQVWLRAVAR